MFKRILVAIEPDDSRTFAAFPPAALLTHACNAELIVCSVVPDSSTMMTAEWTEIGYRNRFATL